ncbi:MAG: hypothetical protein IJF17_03240 [Thermoguttaceae bacterium]|nr:hypothetical protein [Thermoguttaceae bacterium]
MNFFPRQFKVNFITSAQYPLSFLIPVFISVFYLFLFPAFHLKAENAETESQKKERLETQKKLDRELWTERSAGENLAAGKKVLLVPAPDYRLTVVGNTDSIDLTDGLLTTAHYDRLWFDSKCVGWYFADGLERFLLIDLETSQPIEKAVIRCLGGTSHNFRYPKKFEVWVSNDGKDFFQTSAMEKLMPCEAAQADWERFYFLEENAEKYETRAYPFQLAVNAEARYVLLKITGATASVFSDELVLVKAKTKQNPRFNTAFSTPPRQFPLDGVILSTRWHELGIVAGMEIPQHFQMTDLRDSSGSNTENVEMVIEVPQGIRVTAGNPDQIPPQWNVAGTPIQTDRRIPYLRFVYPVEKRANGFLLPKLYFSLEKRVAAQKIFPSVILYARCGGKEQFKTELPIRVETLPEIKPFQKLHVSLAWMGEKEQKEWPNFFENFRKLGFNAVSSFPRYWAKENEKNAANEAFLENARNAGFNVVMNESPLHVMMNGKADGNEIFCQDPAKPGKNLCPTYRGEAYQQEMDRVAECVRRTRPDFLFFDIECWHNASQSARNCQRCQKIFEEARKENPDLTLEEFLFAQGREITADLFRAAVCGSEKAGIPLPVVGSYARQPARPHYAIERFEDTYPNSIHLAMPSLYVAGREKDVHKNIRENHILLQNRQIIPWLSAGCYGEFDPEMMEFMVLESFLNGARGITYYCFADFDTPLDFFFHAKALAQIRPYENLLANGKLIEISGSNPNILYSAFGNSSEFLLLAGNPDGALPEVSIKLPQSHLSYQIKDLRNGEPARSLKPQASLECEVPKGQIRLFHVKAEKKEP